MEVTRRRFLQGVLSLSSGALVSACAAQGSDVSEPGYLLPVLADGETMELSTGSMVFHDSAVRWFRRVDGGVISLFGDVISVDESLDGAEAETDHIGPNVIVRTVGNRTTQFLRDDPKRETSDVTDLPPMHWAVSIRESNSMLIFSGLADGRIDVDQIFEIVREFPAPFPRGTAPPGFLLNPPALTQGSYIVKRADDSVWQHVHFALRADGSLREGERFRRFREERVGPRQVGTVLVDDGISRYRIWSEGQLDVLVVLPKEDSGLPTTLRRMRRVGQAEWDAAYALHQSPFDRPAPPPMEAPEIARWPRDSSLAIPPGIVVEPGFLDGVLDDDELAGATQSCTIRVTGDPPGAVTAGLSRVNERMGSIRVDGSFGESMDQVIEYSMAGPDRLNLEIFGLRPSGIESLRRLIIEELAFAGATRATIRASVDERL